MNGIKRSIICLVKRPLFSAIAASALLMMAITAGCDVTGVEESPEPGVLKVTMQSAPGDTVITIGKERLAVSEGDHFDVSVFQGRIVKDTAYAILYKELSDFQEEEHQYNLLERTEAGAPVQFNIFKTYIPPGTYTSLEFGLTAEQVNVGNFEIPVDLPPEVSSIITFDFEQPIEVNSSDTTEVNLEIKPFESIIRYRDSFRFVRDVSVMNVQYQ